MSTPAPAISPAAVFAGSSDRIKAPMWKKVEKIINGTFALLPDFADEQGLSKAIPVLWGPWHFYVSLERDEGLFIFFSPRRANEHQRIHAEDISEHSKIIISGTKESLTRNHGFSPVYHVQFYPWEFENVSTALKYAKVKVLEVISKIVQDSGHIGRFSTVDFSFPIVASEVDPKLVFVLMPFSEKWSDRIWEKHLKRIIGACDLNPIRADDLSGINVIQDIWHSISIAQIVIADLTGMNPNVYYELGLAHALRKKTVLLSQNFDDIPFDLRPYRHIFYEDNSDGYDILERNLTKSLRALTLRGEA
jgi:hypothetical protein